MRKTIKLSGWSKGQVAASSKENKEKKAFETFLMEHRIAYEKYMRAIR